MPFLAVVWLRDDDETREFLDESGTGRVVGVYRFPKRDVKLCRGFSTGCRRTNWTRHRWGHYVHECNLRSNQWWKQLTVSMIDRFGINLLPREDTPRIFQNPAEWEEPIKLGAFGDVPDFSTEKQPHSEE
jgi:hypothetical protein